MTFLLFISLSRSLAPRNSTNEAVCCSVLQCVAVCCSVLQCVVSGTVIPSNRSERVSPSLILRARHMTHSTLGVPMTPSLVISIQHIKTGLDVVLMRCEARNKDGHADGMASYPSPPG